MFLLYLGEKKKLETNNLKYIEKQIPSKSLERVAFGSCKYVNLLFQVNKFIMWPTK